jgi:hypothetical protein
MKSFLALFLSFFGAGCCCDTCGGEDCCCK